MFSVFIKHPVAAVMFNLAMVIMGATCFLGLAYNSMPDVDLPIASVFVQMPGGNPETIESEITKRIEDVVASISGLDEYSSSTMSGSSSITVQFEIEKDADVAIKEVQDKIATVQGNFPSDTMDPIVQKVSPNDTPIMVLTLSGDRDIKEMTEICRQDLKMYLQTIKGVGQINILGGCFREISIEVDLDLLNKYGLTITDVNSAIDAQNKEVPGGRLTGSSIEYTMRSMGRLTDISQYKDIVVSNKNGSQIYLGDIAKISDGTKEQRTFAGLDGKNALSIQIIKIKGGNTVEVIDKVKANWDVIKGIVPSDLHIEIIKDQSKTIKESVDEIFEHLYLGGGLACLLTFLFMKNIRTTFIAGIAIPTSVVATFIVMKINNYTLDTITLLALALVVGIVIDDAVVVLENIWRLIEEKGLKPYEAAIQGIQEIGMAVLATSACLMVMFIPLGFISGIVGKFISCYGITMASSVLFSMIVSFTLTPMLCSKLMVPPKEAGKPDAITKWMQDTYEFFLRMFLNPIGSILMLVICGLLLFWTIGLAGVVKSEFVSNNDEGQYDVLVKLPGGWPIDRSSKVLTQIQKEIMELPHIQHVLLTIGTANAGDEYNESSDITSGNIYVKMDEYEDRAYNIMSWIKDLATFHMPKKIYEYTQTDSMKVTRKILAKYSSMLRTQTCIESATNGSASPDLSYIIQGTDLALLEKAANHIVEKLSATPGIVDVDTDMVFATPEVHIEFDRKACADRGINMEQAGRILSAMIGGQKLSGTYLEGRWSYDVRVRLQEKDRNSPEILDRIQLTNASGERVILSSIASIKQTVGPAKINHFNGQRSVTITFNTDGYSAGKAMQDCKKYFEECKLPKDYNEAVTGNSKYMIETAVSLAGALVIALLFVYMVLASQFGSYFDPLLVLATVPMTVPFALISLTETDKSLNLMSGLGLFLLFGIVMKNAILQVEHANHVLKTSNLKAKEAIIVANKDRLRPILMTTLTIIVGMLPVAIAGSNGNMKSPMAVVVVGGQAMCFFLTLLMVPVLQNIQHGIYRMIGWEAKEPGDDGGKGPDDGGNGGDGGNGDEEKKGTEVKPVDNNEQIDEPKQEAGQGKEGKPEQERKAGQGKEGKPEQEQENEANASPEPEASPKPEQRAKDKKAKKGSDPSASLAMALIFIFLLVYSCPASAATINIKTEKGQSDGLVNKIMTYQLKWIEANQLKWGMSNSRRTQESFLNEPALPDYSMEIGGEEATIEDCLKIAYLNSPDILRAGHEVKQYEAKVRQAMSLYIPDANLILLRSDARIPALRDNYWNNSITGEISYLIYDSGKRRHLCDAAGNSLTASRYSFLGSWNDKAYNVAIAYLNALYAGKMIWVCEDDLFKTRDNLQIAQGFYTIGTKAKIDVTQAEIQVKNSEINLIEAQANFINACSVLLGEMGVSPDEIDYRKLKDILTDTDVPSFKLDELFETAEARNPMLGYYEYMKRAAIDSADSYLADRLPTLSTNASWGGKTNWGASDTSWSVNFQLKIPLLKNTESKAYSDEQKAVAAQAEDAKNSTRITIREGLATSVINISAAKKKCEQAYSAVETALLNYRLSFLRYKQGVSVITELNNAIDFLNNARIQYLNALLDLRKNEASVYKMTGYKIPDVDPTELQRKIEAYKEIDKQTDRGDN